MELRLLAVCAQEMVTALIKAKLVQLRTIPLKCVQVVAPFCLFLSAEERNMRKGGGEQERPVATGDRCCRKSDDRSDAFIRGKDGGSLWRHTEDRRVKENRNP